MAAVLPAFLSERKNPEDEKDKDSFLDVTRKYFFQYPWLKSAHASLLNLNLDQVTG